MSTPFPMPAQTPVWHLYRTLVGIGVFCAVAIVAAFDFTKAPIQRNKVAARKQAVFVVLPAAKEVGTFRRGEGGRYAQVPDDTEGDGLVLAGFDAGHELVGLAIEVAGSGYGSDLRVLYAYSFAQQAIVGMTVLQSSETPGLGDAVDSHPGYKKNFEQLDVALSADRQTLAHPIEFTKQGQKKHAWQIDGITGATITTRSIAQMVAKSAAAVVPGLAASSADFVLAPPRNQ